MLFPLLLIAGAGVIALRAATKDSVESVDAADGDRRVVHGRFAVFSQKELDDVKRRFTGPRAEDFPWWRYSPEELTKICNAHRDRRRISVQERREWARLERAWRAADAIRKGSG